MKNKIKGVGYLGLLSAVSIAGIFFAQSGGISFFSDYKVENATVKLSSHSEKLTGTLVRPKFSKEFVLTDSKNRIIKFGVDDIELLSHPLPEKKNDK